jgi:PAS domain-containing protein
MKRWPTLEMLVINRAYEDIYGIEAASYVGQNDGTVWGEDTAAHFNEADRAAFESNGAVTRQETFRNPKTGQMETTTTVKWPVLINGVVVGIAGIITERKMVGGLALAAPEDQ